jgi:hypothetical protein
MARKGIEHGAAKQAAGTISNRIDSLASRDECVEEDISFKHQRLLREVDNIDGLLDGLSNLLSRIAPEPTTGVDPNKQSNRDIGLVEMLNTTPYVIQEKISFGHDIIRRINQELFDL